MYITYNAILQGFLHIHCIHRVVLTDLRVPALKPLSPTQGPREDGKVKNKEKIRKYHPIQQTSCGGYLL